MQSADEQLDRKRTNWLIAVGGLGFETLPRIVERGIMPKMATILPRLARADWRTPFFSCPNATWTTLETGQEIAEHGYLDDVFPNRRRLLPTKPVPQNLFIIVHDPTTVWHRKPADERELDVGLEQTTKILEKSFADFLAAKATSSQRPILLKLTVFDSLFLRLWHLLGIESGPAGRPSWIAKTQAVFRSLDERLAAVFELAEKGNATISLASPYGFVPFREKIVLNELLRRKKLFCPAEGAAYAKYSIVRFFEKRKRRLCFDDAVQSIDGLLPIDWRRTRAFAMHGENAAFVYLNSPERFGRGDSMNSKQREETVVEVIAALTDARHPNGGEPLFREAFSTAERFGIDPIEKHWPEVIGIPAEGYQIRHRLDRARQLVRPDPSVAAARTGEGRVFVSGWF